MKLVTFSNFWPFMLISVLMLLVLLVTVLLFFSVLTVLNVEERVAKHTVMPQGTNTLLPVTGIVTMTTMTVIIVMMIW